MTAAPPPTDKSLTVRSMSERTVVLLEQSTSFTVATVPKKDLGLELAKLQSTRLLIRLASELYGSSRSSVITSEEYETAVELIQGREIWEAFQSDYLDLYEYSAPGTELDLGTRIETFARTLDGFDEKWDPYRENWGTEMLLARHAFLSQLGPARDLDVAQATLFSNHVPFSHILYNARDNHVLQQLEQAELSPQSFLLALEIHNSALTLPYEIRDLVPLLYEYEVPFGNSPEGRFERIVDMLRGGYDSIVVRVKSTAEAHERKMNPSATHHILLGMRDDVAGVGSGELRGRLEATIARGMGGTEEPEQESR